MKQITINDFDAFFEAVLEAVVAGHPGKRVTQIHPDSAHEIKAHALSFWYRAYGLIANSEVIDQSIRIRAAANGYVFSSSGYGSVDGSFFSGFWKNVTEAKRLQRIASNYVGCGNVKFL